MSCKTVGEATQGHLEVALTWIAAQAVAADRLPAKKNPFHGLAGLCALPTERGQQRERLGVFAGGVRSEPGAAADLRLRASPSP